MNSGQQVRQSEIAEQESEQPRLAELSPDDFSEAGEPGLEDLPANPEDTLKKEWNPDDFQGRRAGGTLRYSPTISL